MNKTLPILPILLAGVATWGCGPSDEYCAEVESAASQVVLDAVAEDQACTVDEDCEVVAVNGSCFDNCSRVIAVTNHEVFEAALDEAEADHCVDYDGCTLIIPPCAPPDDAACGDDGYCTGG
jgi:hypothetical protein